MRNFRRRKKLLKNNLYRVGVEFMPPPTLFFYSKILQNLQFIATIIRVIFNICLNKIYIITHQIYLLLQEKITPQEAVKNLMARELKNEE